MVRGVTQISYNEIYNLGNSSQRVPQGDHKRQAVAPQRGYNYQVLAAALEWLDIGEHCIIYLEVAEDYAKVENDTIHLVQVKDTGKSGSITLISESVKDAIANFVNHVNKNKDRSVSMRFFTTSEIGTEKSVSNVLSIVDELIECSFLDDSSPSHSNDFTSGMKRHS